MKKFTSVLLAVVMLMSVICMPAKAVNAEDCLGLIGSYNPQTGMVSLKVVAKQATTNGKFTVTFNSEHLVYENAQVDGIVAEVAEGDGKLTVSYANTSDEAAIKGRIVATLNFSSCENWTTTDIHTTLNQFNAYESLDLQLPTVTIYGGGNSTPVDPVPPSDPNPPVIIPPSDPNPPVDPTPGVGGGSGSGGGSTEQPEEPEITVDPDGTVTETVENKDGSTTVNVETPDGTTSTTVTDKNGDVVEAKAEISSKVENGETVTIPVEVPAASSSEKAVSVEITVPATVEEITVEIPVTNVTPGTVIVLVHEDGTEEIVNTTALTEDGLAITVDGSVTVKVVDNTKNFSDTGDHWADDQITFVTAREIFQGTGNGEFTPEGQMTRAMMMTVLARLGGHDTSAKNGEDWAAPGIEWAMENGICDGSRPNDNITREELVTMLYLFAGAPESAGELESFTDSGNVSGFAADAMKWAVENGIISGMGDGTINPQGEATRAQLAKILMYFINL